MIKLHIHYQDIDQDNVVLRVPDMGLSPLEWAEATFTALAVPHTTVYGVPGAQDVARAVVTARDSGVVVEPVGAGDAVEVGGRVVRCHRVIPRHDAWSVGLPVWNPPQPVPMLPGPALHVSASCPPPDAVAYAEDRNDRLWTGRGAGTWRCLTDPAGRTAPGGWAGVWNECGPLVPLVPVQVVRSEHCAEPIGG